MAQETHVKMSCDHVEEVVNVLEPRPYIRRDLRKLRALWGPGGHLFAFRKGSPFRRLRLEPRPKQEGYEDFYTFGTSSPDFDAKLPIQENSDKDSTEVFQHNESAI
jgi:hypothetical protein